MIKTFCLLCLMLQAAVFADPVIPTAYQGRIRPLEATARLWLYDLYHRQQLRKEDLADFDTTSPSATNFFWTLHRVGHQRWDSSPLFWIHHAQTKELLGFDPKQDRVSYAELKQAMIDDEKSNLAMVELLVSHQFVEAFRAPTNRTGATRLELSSLAPGLWVALQDNALVVVQAPTTAPWQRLKPGNRLGARISQRLEKRHQADKAIADELLTLWSHLRTFENIQASGAAPGNAALAEAVTSLRSRGMKAQDIAQTLDMQLPLRNRLLEAGSEPKVLPGRLVPGEWYSLQALGVQVFDPKTESLVPVGNFTVYPDALFEQIRQQDPSSHEMGELLLQGYQPLEGSLLKEGGGKALRYPTEGQLVAEAWYYSLPLPLFALVLYALAALLFGLAFSLYPVRIAAWAVLASAWLLHTAILIIRCYILARPPVANMFETVVYVPWIAVTLSLLLFARIRSLLIPLSASLLAVALLAILEVTQLHHGLETVQPVLDSQYWLIIHVLLVVASYGVFLLSGVLGHLYLLLRALRPQSKAVLAPLSKAILHSMYIGTAMLVAGTILGGVWAAESWGRFWDWDPKESWAFISSCAYIVCIHAYTFNHIREVGLAVGSIVGLWAISFTWYGVNYILGTGLHSYGFGSGGELYYYIFLIGELLFVAACLRKGRLGVLATDFTD